MRPHILCAVLSLSAFSARSATIHVPGHASTIQAGIDLATTGDTVLVACGTYYEHSISMKSGVVLRSDTGQPDCVTIDAQQLGRLILCTDLAPTTRIEGLTLTGGSWSFGGGMRCSNSSVVVADCVLSYNSATARGGGMYCEGGASPTLSACVFSGNSASYGGGLACSASSPTLTDCTFSDNWADAGGGMVAWTSSSPSLTGCLFDNNSAEIGGGLDCYSQSSPILTNCTFFENSANSGWGGGLSSGDYASPVVRRTIVAFSTQGDAVSCDATGSASLTCCNVFGNAAGDWVNCIAGQATSGGNMSDDPLFCHADIGVFTLDDDSPCLASNNGCSVQIGAFGCGCLVDIAEDSWARIKARYR